MRRGFKAEAERVAEQLRARIGLARTDELDPFKLASNLAVRVCPADQLVDRASLLRLEELQPGAFSACTISTSTGDVIVYNPLSTPGRTNSDIAHELAHIVLEHEVNQVAQLGDLTFFTCNPDEEQEANWLAGALLLPRSLLVRAVKRGWTSREVAETYRVSEQMAQFRIRATGVDRQVGASRRRT